MKTVACEYRLVLGRLAQLNPSPALPANTGRAGKLGVALCGALVVAIVVLSALALAAGPIGG